MLTRPRPWLTQRVRSAFGFRVFFLYQRVRVRVRTRPLVKSLHISIVSWVLVPFGRNKSLYKTKWILTTAIEIGIINQESNKAKRPTLCPRFCAFWYGSLNAVAEVCKWQWICFIDLKKNKFLYIWDHAFTFFSSLFDSYSSRICHFQYRYYHWYLLLL